jgi:hypothetical protein
MAWELQLRFVSEGYKTASKRRWPMKTECELIEDPHKGPPIAEHLKNRSL